MCHVGCLCTDASDCVITTKIGFGSGTKLHVDARKIESLQSAQNSTAKLNFKMLHTEKKTDSKSNFKLDSLNR